VRWLGWVRGVVLPALLCVSVVLAYSGGDTLGARGHGKGQVDCGDSAVAVPAMATVSKGGGGSMPLRVCLTAEEEVKLALNLVSRSLMEGDRSLFWSVVLVGQVGTDQRFGSGGYGAGRGAARAAGGWPRRVSVEIIKAITATGSYTAVADCEIEVSDVGDGGTKVITRKSAALELRKNGRAWQIVDGKVLIDTMDDIDRYFSDGME
jgi:hypothetical protein